MRIVSSHFLFFFPVCGYTGGCIKCTSEGLKLVVLNDNYTTCCTPNIATVGAEYINVYEKPSECPGWLEEREKEHEIIIGESLAFKSVFII